MYDEAGRYQAFVWNANQGIQPIGPADRYSSAIAVNDHGHVVIQGFSDVFLYAGGNLIRLELSTQYPSQPLAMNNWYGADGESLRAGIRFLSECRDDFGNNGRIREEFKADLARCSGEDFLSDLIKWEPGNWEAVVLADHLVKHAEQFRRPLPTIATEAAPEVLPDPFQGRPMVSKLLNQEIRHLSALALISDQKAGVGGGGFNGRALRFLSDNLKSAMDDLQRAVEWYRRLRRHNL